MPASQASHFPSLIPTASPHPRGLVGSTLGILNISHGGMGEDESLALPRSNGRNCRDPTHTPSKTIQLGTLGWGSAEPVFWANWKLLKGTHVESRLKRASAGCRDGCFSAWETGLCVRSRLRPQCSELIYADPAFQNHSAASKTTKRTGLSVKLCILLLFTIEN